MPAQQISPLKKAIFSVAALMLFLFLFFIIGEVMFRIFRGAPNPLSRTTQLSQEYLFKPNSVLENRSSKHGEFSYTAHINRYGYRGADFAMPKEEGKLRVFAVGDSFTFGVGSQDNETIPYLIEENLKQQGLNTEVVNAGIGHASPLRHVVNFRNIHFKYGPDVVLLLLDMTDIQDDWRQERYAVFDENGQVKFFDTTYLNGKRSLWRTLAFYSAFCKYIDQKVLTSWEKLRLLGLMGYIRVKQEEKRAKAVIVNAEEGAYPDSVLLEYDGFLMMRGKTRERLIRQQFARTGKYLLEIKQLLEERGIPMALVMYPHGIYVGEDQWNEGRVTWGFEAGKQYSDRLPFEMVEAFAKANDIPFINTLDAFLAAPKKQYFFDWDGHMTPEGNKIVADVIVRSPAFQGILAQRQGIVKED
ncbi:MAG TPA: hypothetical protein VI749_01520 [Candidatus Omnitrophota bacterium]|nr:hypothetical protein [Candidatus Omnitrophota bacterium]